jgi:hypothetical protein
LCGPALKEETPVELTKSPEQDPHLAGSAAPVCASGYIRLDPSAIPVLAHLPTGEICIWIRICFSYSWLRFRKALRHRSRLKPILQALLRRGSEREQQ